MKSLTQAERNVIYAVRNHSFFQHQFAVEIVNDYFGLLAQTQVIRDRQSAAQLDPIEALRHE